MSIYLGSSEPSKIYVGSNEVAAVYVGDKKVRPSEWTPGANTIAYFPFEDDQLDHSGNGLTINNTLNKEAIGYSLTEDMSNTNIVNSKFVKFVGCWYIVNSISSSSYALGILGTTNLGASVYFAGSGDSSQRNKIMTYQGSDWTVVGSTEGMSYNARHYLAFSFYNGVLYVCRDGVASVQYNGTPDPYSGCDIVLMQKGSGVNFKVTYSNLIVESEGWTEQQMTEYYNQTKSLYGIS